MAIRNFFLPSFERKNKDQTADPVEVGLSLLPKKGVRILRPDRLKNKGQSIALPNFFAIFPDIQSIISFVVSKASTEGKRTYRYFSNHPNSYQLLGVVKRAFQSLKNTQPPVQVDHSSPIVRRLIAEMQTQSNHVEVEAFLADNSQLKAISHLRTVPLQPQFDVEVFEALFHRKGGYQVGALTKIIEFAKGFMPSGFIDQSRINSLLEGIKRDIHFRNLVREGKDQGSAVRKEKLKALAQVMSDEVQKLPIGQSYVILGGVQNGKSLTCPLFNALFEEFLPQDLHQLLTQDLSEEVVQRLTKKLSDQVWGTEGTKPKVSQIELGIRWVVSKAKKLAETVLPINLYDGLLESLKSDLKEVILGHHDSGSFEEKIWKQLNEKGIEKAWQETLLEVLESSRKIVDGQTEAINEQVMANLPVAARSILDVMGLPKREKDTIWFELEKQVDSNYKLTVFAKGAAAEPHPNGQVGEQVGIQLPLTYSNINPSKLDDAFFYSLLCPLVQLDPNVQSTVTHIHEGPIASLGQSPDAPKAQTLVSLEALQGESTWEYLSLYLRHHLQMDQADFDKEYSYNLRLQAFIHMWARVQESPSYLADHPILAQHLRVAVSELSDVGVQLYQNGKLSFQELKALYATVWEAEKVLKIEVSQVKTASSVIMPPGLQEMAKQLVLAIGMSPTQISLIKEALMVVYGSNIEEVVDQAIRDVLPTLTADEMNEARSKCSSDSLYTYEGMKRTYEQLKSFRLSLLHAVRLYVVYSRVMIDIFQATMASRLIESFITSYFPVLATYTTMSLTRLSQLLVCFGPSVLKPIIPDLLYQSIRAIYRLSKEISSYVQRRLTFTVIRIVARILMGQETASKLSAQARNWNQRITRSGELSYLVPCGKNDVGQLKIKPQKAPISPEATRDVVRTKQSVEAKVGAYGSTSELPRPYRVVLTKDNLHKELNHWVLEAEVLFQEQGFSRSKDQRLYQMLLYLNHQFRNLPLPAQTEIWDEVDPIKTMQLIKQLISQFSKVGCASLSIDETTEIVTSYYTAYALMDHLSRRSAEAEIPSHLQANGCDLMQWMQHPATRIINPDVQNQLSKVCAYFGFDINKSYTEEEIRARRPNCLFNYQGKGERFYTPAFGSGSEGKFTTTYRGLLHSTEGAYYRQLLKREDVQHCLRGCGVDQSASEWNQFLALFQNSPGSQGSPLPAAFAMLREMDSFARASVQNLQVPKQLFLVGESLDDWAWTEVISETVLKVCGMIKQGAHFITRHYFLQEQFDAPGLYLAQADDKEERLRKRFFMRGREHRLTGGESHRLCYAAKDLRAQSKFFTGVNRRSVNQIMVQDPLDLRDLSPQERRALEMINLDKGDQVMDTLRFFIQNMGRLREARFRYLFDLFIHRVGAAKVQIKERIEVSTAMGAFFQKAIDQFECQEDFDTCLFLTKIGQEFRRTIGTLPEETFPDFRSFIRYRLIPYLRTFPLEKRIRKFAHKDQDPLVHCYNHLILTYGVASLQKESEEERRQIVEDIGRRFYTMLKTDSQCDEKRKPDVMIKAEQVLFLWESPVKAAMREDPEIRKAVIEHVLRDIGMESMIQKEDAWDGTYPIFSNGRITLDLTNQTQNAHEVSNALAYERAKEIVQDPGRCFRLSTRSFSFPEKQMILEFAEGTFHGKIPCKLYRQFDGVDYEYLPSHRLEIMQAGKPFSLATDEKLYLERPHWGYKRHLLCKNGEETLWKRPVRASKDEKGNPLFKVRFNRKVINGISVREVNLATEPHGLALLNWFEDESHIKAYAHSRNPSQLAFIEIPKWDLCFEIKEHGKELQAVSVKKTGGYFLSKVQRDENLLKYGKYLLLENAKGERKVHIVSKSLKAVMADSILRNLTQIKASPLLERYLEALAPNLIDQERQLLTFDIDAEGNLKTSDPVGLAYLSLFHFVNGDHKESLRYFSDLECYGRRHPYPEEIYKIFDLMYFPLLCEQDRPSREIALRLGAIQAENHLIQHSEETGKATRPKSENEKIKLVKWILLQIKFAQELKAKSHGLPSTLNDFQELFLLAEMSRMNQEYYQSYVGENLPETLNALSRQVGLENLANTFLFSPIVMERYHELRLQLENDSGLKSVARGVAIQAIQAVFSGDAQTNVKVGLQKGALSQMIHAVNKVKESRLLDDWGKGSFRRAHLVRLDPTLEEVPTKPWEIDGKALDCYFSFYYRLAKNQPPRRVDKVHFNQKREEFLRSLDLMQGKYSSEEALQREILRVVGRETSVVSFGSADRFESRIRDFQKASNADMSDRAEDLDDFFASEIVRPCRRAKAAQAVLTRSCGMRVLHIGYQVGKAVACLLPGYSCVYGSLIAWKWLKRGLSFCRAVRHENRREIKLSEAVLSRARSELAKRPLEKKIAILLKQRDGAINRAMDDLFNEFFSVQEATLPIDPTQVARYDGKGAERIVEQALVEVNAGLDQFYRRPREMQLKIEFKRCKDPAVFLERARELNQSLRAFLTKEEKAIEDLVQNKKRHLREDEETQIVHRIKHQQFGEEKAAFNTIYGLFSSCDDEAMVRQIGLDPDAWEELKTRLYLYQTVRRRLNLLSNQLRQTSQGNIAEAKAIGQELRRRPSYSFCQDVPEIVIRAKLTYETALEFMLYRVALQTEQADRLLLSHFKAAKKFVLEQIMGTGKTFLMALSDRVFADGDSLVVNMAIDSVAPSNFEMFIKNGKKAFRQVGSILRFNRSMTWTLNQLWGLFQILRRAVHFGETLNARAKDMQGLELRFLEETFDVEGKFKQTFGAKWKQRLQCYKDSLLLLRQKGVENSDEKHKIDEPTSGVLNFPLGAPLRLQDEEIRIINEIMLLLVQLPEFLKYIKIKSKRPEKLAADVYENKIKALLAKRVASIELLGISEENRDEFAHYLEGKACVIPRFVINSPHRRAIGQAKGLVTVLLRHALNNVINVDFTVSKKPGNGEYARPAEGNDHPLENSTILKPDEAYVKTLMRLFQARLTDAQLRRLITRLHEEAKADEKKLGCHVQETMAGRFFAAHCKGYQIDTYQKEDLPKIFKMLNRSDWAMTFYGARFIANDIVFYKRFLSSNCENLHDIFGKKQYSRTGTPKNYRCYPQGTEILSHPGTEGESVHILEKKFSTDTSIQILEQSDPRLALREIIYRFFHVNPRLTALIDLDPICNNLSPEAINAEFQAYIAKNRPEIQGIVYYDKDKNLVVAKRGATHATPFEESNIPAEKRISIFDHTHFTASNIPQAPNAEAILTVGENVTLSDLAQAYDRMRGARRGKQRLTIVMTQRALKNLSWKQAPSIRDIIRLAAENEAKKLAKHHYLSDRYKLHNCVRNKIINKALNASTIDETIAIIREFENVLIMSVDDDPFEIYGYIDVMMDPHQVIDNYRENLLARVSLSKRFSQTDIQALRTEMEEIGRDTFYPKEGVHIYKIDGGTRESDMMLGQQVHQCQDSENDQESEVDTNIHVNVSQNAAPPSPKQSIISRCHLGWSWPDALDPTNIDSYFNVTKPDAWFLSRPVPIYSLRDLLKKSPDLAFLSGAVGSCIYVSENFAQQRDNRWFWKAGAIQPLGEHQTPLFRALVIHDRRKGHLEQKILLLHKEEVPFWRKKLAEDREKKLREQRSGFPMSDPLVKVALYDFVNNTITASGGNTLSDQELHENQIFQQASTHIKFTVMAELNYSDKEKEVLKPWIKSHDPRKMRTAFEGIHEKRGMGHYSGSDVETLFFNASGVPLDMRIRI